MIRQGANDPRALWIVVSYYYSMFLSQECLYEFMQLYKEEFGKEITKGEAEEITHRLITLYMKLLEPLPSEKHERHAAS